MVSKDKSSNSPRSKKRSSPGTDKSGKRSSSGTDKSGKKKQKSGQKMVKVIPIKTDSPKKLQAVTASIDYSSSSSSPVHNQNANGEELGACSDNEWKRAAPAYNSTLLNIKKKPNCPTVFAAPVVKVKEKQASLSAPVKIMNTNERVSAIGRLVAGIAEAVMDGRNQNVEVEVIMKINDGEAKTIES